MRALLASLVVLSLAMAGCGESKTENKVQPYNPALKKAVEEREQKKNEKAKAAEPAEKEEAPGEAPAKPE